MTTRITDLAQSRVVRSVILDAQNRMSDNQIKLSTLQKSQNYSGISESSNRLVGLETSNQRMEKFLEDNTFIKLRLDTMLNSINSMKSVLGDVRDILRDIDGEGVLTDGIDKDSTADVKISEIKDFLNVQINGRYLFAGSKTTTKPVVPGTLSNAPAFDSNFETKPEASFYYQGDETKSKARIAEGVVLNYGDTAADPAFEKLIRSVRILRSTDISGGDANFRSKITHALELANQAEDGLQAMEMNIGTKIQQLDTTNKNLETSKNFFQNIISEIEGVNTFEAVTELQQDQNMLEASFSTIVKLANMSLAKFI